MNDKKTEQLVDRLDPTLLNESIINEPFFDAPVEFEANHTQNIIDKLIHLSRFGNLLTLVVGNNGCGKTYTLDKLISSVDDSCQICHINAQPLLSIDQLFQQVIESFAGETTFTGIPLTANQYEDWAEQLSTISGNRLLLIDDAEVLSTSVLHELCQLSAMQQEKETPHLHLILFGNYDLNNILEQASHGVLNEEGIYAIDIPSLTDEGAKEWLEYLFNRDGVVFSPEADELEKMLVKGQGNLALLEEEAGEYSASSHEFDEFENKQEQEPWRVSGIGYWFGGLTILIMLVLGLFFFQKELTALFGIADDQVPVVVKEQKVLDFTTTEDSVDTATSEQSIDEITSGDALTPKLDNDQSVEKVIDEKVIDETTPSSDVQLEDNEARNEESTTNEVVVEKVVTQEESDSESSSNSNNKDEVIVDAVKDDAVKDDAEISINTAANEESHLTQNEQLIMSFSDDDYAVQLIGLRKENDVKSFIAKYSLTKMLYYKSSLGDKPWYIVILANYNTKEDASLARLKLSDDLRKHGPWIKSVKAIKNELSKAQ